VLSVLCGSEAVNDVYKHSLLCLNVHFPERLLLEFRQLLKALSTILLRDGELKAPQLSLHLGRKGAVSNQLLEVALTGGKVHG
jgi:hypothetical protein